MLENIDASLLTVSLYKITRMKSSRIFDSYVILIFSRQHHSARA